MKKKARQTERDWATVMTEILSEWGGGSKIVAWQNILKPTVLHMCSVFCYPETAYFPDIPISSQ